MNIEPLFLKITKMISDPSVEKVLKDILQEFETSFSKTTTKEPTNILNLIQEYSELLDQKFVHKSKKTTYTLVRLLNTKSTDQVKFPVMASYFDHQLKTTWCRPLVDFNTSFQLI